MVDATALNRPLRAALIVDGQTLPAWAALAVSRALSLGRMQLVAIFVCTNNAPNRRLIKHLGYYAMRSLLGTPAAWRRRPLASVVGPEIDSVTFEAERDGLWQRVPETVHRCAAGMDLDVVIKFGMGLLRDPQQFPARFGVLSYHHGDPTCYRGRPAAFYEVYDDATYVGAVVQRLTNRLDGGEFLAHGRFRIERHSYKATLESLYTGSSFLLEKALAACVQARATPAPVLGTNYRLPANLTTLRFMVRLFARKVARLTYGAFWRKGWHLFEIDRTALNDFTGDRVLQCTPLPLPYGVDFLADPFYLDSKGELVVCERMSRGRVQGDLVRMTAARDYAEPVIAAPGRHLSYPYVLRSNGRLFLLPEVADWSAPMLMELDPSDGSLQREIPLRGLESERLVDPSVVEHAGLFWLFATPASRYRNLDTLMVWNSKQLEGPYRPHQHNPIVLNPSNARSGGRILNTPQGLIRFGQINSGAYGSGLAVMLIEDLTIDTFCERQIGTLQWKGYVGPHTIDFSSERIILDGYRDLFDPTAWLHRLRQLLNRGSTND